MRRLDTPCRAPLALALLLGGAAAAPQDAAGDAALSMLLQQQTQAFSEAGQKGDAATMDRMLDPTLVFTNEAGVISTKKDLVEGASPPPAGTVVPGITVTQWSLHRQREDLATATFVDVVTHVFGAQTLTLKFQSTETWIRRPDGWKMVASQTMNVQAPPAPVALPAAVLNDYVGLYELSPAYHVAISRAKDGLVASTNGGTELPLQAELKDVLFTPAAPNVRRIFQRDAAGHIQGYISRRDGVDVVLKKIG